MRDERSSPGRGREKECLALERDTCTDIIRIHGDGECWDTQMITSFWMDESLST